MKNSITNLVTSSITNNKSMPLLPSPIQIMNDLINCKMAFDANLLKVTKPIRAFIIGEAPQTFSNYFYNPNFSGSSFMRPNDLNKKFKNYSDLVSALNCKGIVVIDLFPLPIPSAYYKNTNFFDQLELSQYWDDLFSRLPTAEKLTIGIRYKKIKNDHFVKYQQFQKALDFFYKPLPAISTEMLGSNNMPIERDLFKAFYSSLP